LPVKAESERTASRIRRSQIYAVDLAPLHLTLENFEHLIRLSTHPDDVVS
jgi:hypothetical protein